MQTRRLAATAIALIASIGLVLGLTAAAGADAPGGLSGHTVTFRVTSPDADQACVSYYKARKDGSAIDFPVTITAEQLPFKVKVGTGTKLGHWHITAYASDDCESTNPPDGTVKCQLRVDGKVKDTNTGKDQLVFCDV